jgi:Ca2+-dependent lipid-binding protein
MTARYVPVSIVLEPRESINSKSSQVKSPPLPDSERLRGGRTELMIDMGILRVEVIGAKNLMAGDRSGKSDVCSPVF